MGNSPLGDNDHYREERKASKPTETERAWELAGRGIEPAGRASEPGRKVIELGGRGLEPARKTSELGLRAI